MLKLTVCVAVVLFVACFAQASAIMNLSGYSSTPEVPASWLNASMTFAVSSNVLTLTVQNNTPSGGGPGFYINNVWFNTTNDVTGLSPISAPDGWAFLWGDHTNQAPGAGYFDVQLNDGVGNSPHEIAPGNSLTWKFSFTGSGEESCFTTELSLGPGGFCTPVAAKFIRGGCDDLSSTGGVPEPATLGLLGLGLAGLVMKRKR